MYLLVGYGLMQNMTVNLFEKPEVRYQISQFRIRLNVVFY